jgi:two-component system nitrate/nitrite response regulator NarL
MRTGTPLFELESTPEADAAGIQGAIRTLVNLLQRTGGETRGGFLESSSGIEEILADTQVDGIRYLLVRMPRPAHGRVQLSPREQEIVRMVAQGHPNKVIADVLNISSWTVCTHLRRIFAKLGVGSRAAMVAQLLEIGAPGKRAVPQQR